MSATPFYSVLNLFFVLVVSYEVQTAVVMEIFIVEVLDGLQFEL